MKVVCCKDGEEVELNEILNSTQPLVLTTDSLSGEAQFLISLPDLNHFNILSFRHGQPCYPANCFEIPDSFMVVVRHEKGYACFTCLSHQEASVSICAHSRRTFIVRSSLSIRNTRGPLPVLLCIIEQSLYQALHLSALLSIKLIEARGKLAKDKGPLPIWMEALGWDSSALGFRATHDKVVNAVWSLRNAGVQVRFALIDEGWQENSMEGFDADPKRFPYKIKGLVEELHRAGVQHVGLWHSILGNRHGSSDENNPVSGLGGAFQFFYRFYCYLSCQGISFVKIGNQNRAGKVITHLQAASQAAAGIVFEIPPLNTDCLKYENQFYWTTSLLASAGDNLEKQDSKDYKTAIRNMLANTLWLQHYMLPDYQAWQTDLKHSEALAMLHALSGSINMISDLPGRHDENVIKKIALPSGHILRTDTPLNLCKECVFEDPLKNPIIYKAYTYKGNMGLLAAFNLFDKNKTLHAAASPEDVEGLAGNFFAAYSHHRGFLGIVEKNFLLEISLKPNQGDIITFSPVEKGIALIGCYLFFVPSGPITEITIEEESVHLSSMVIAPIMIYCEKEVLEIRCNGDAIPWEYDTEKGLLILDSRTNLLELPAKYTVFYE